MDGCRPAGRNVTKIAIRNHMAKLATHSSGIISSEIGCSSHDLLLDVFGRTGYISRLPGSFNTACFLRGIEIIYMKPGNHLWGKA